MLPIVEYKLCARDIDLYCTAIVYAYNQRS